MLPVGISFYTFATLSYTLDVYLRRAAPARNFLDYALFVTFFPHLVAGPIMRPTELVPQFAEPRRATADQLRFGLALMTLGLFQKIVLADSFLARPAEMVYDGTKIPGVLDSWIATLAFSGPDLLRFRRVLDDRDRRRDVPRLRDAGQLPLSVRRGRLLGFLAALAHHAVVVAARLPLHSARRQPAWRGAHVHRADDDDAARRPLARRELGVRRLGRTARRSISRPSACCSKRFAGYRPGPLALLGLGLLTYALINVTWVFFRAKSFGKAWSVLRGMFGFNEQAEPILPVVHLVCVVAIVCGNRVRALADARAHARIRDRAHARADDFGGVGTDGVRDRDCAGNGQCLHLLPVLRPCSIRHSCPCG